MAVLSAKQLRQRENPEVIIDLGGGDEIVVRRPDLQTLIFQDLMPMPLLRSVLSLISEWVGKDAKNISEDVLSKSDSLRQFVAVWLCAASVMPKITMDGAGESIAVSDLTVKTQLKIFDATFNATFFNPAREVAEAQATEFHQDGQSAGAGPDGAEVLPEAVSTP